MSVPILDNSKYVLKNQKTRGVLIAEVSTPLIYQIFKYGEIFLTLWLNPQDPPTPTNVREDMGGDSALS